MPGCGHVSEEAKDDAHENCCAVRRGLINQRAPSAALLKTSAH